MAPPVSVLMTVYNGERYLRGALSSVLDQTFPDFEVVVVDDGSEDGSPAILEEFAKSDERIRVIRQGNAGLIGALNAGLAEAGGRYIARMDADDECLPERFERQVDYLDQNDDAVAVGCQCVMIDPDGWPICPLELELDHEAIEARMLSGRGALPHPGTMIRRGPMQEIGGYRSRFVAAEDLDLFLRLAEKGRLANLPETLLRYRLHLKSESHIRHRQQQENSRLAVREACERRGIEPPDQAGRAEPPASKSDCHRSWCRWALKAGNKRTARKHALSAVRRDPLNRQSWRMLKWAIRGY